MLILNHLRRGDDTDSLVQDYGNWGVNALELPILREAIDVFMYIHTH